MRSGRPALRLVPIDGAPSPAADRVEQLIAECAAMREHAAAISRRARALVGEARKLVDGARAQRARGAARAAMPFPPPPARPR